MKKKKKYKIPFNNDIYFKYLIGGDDNDSKYMREIIIESCIGIKAERTIVIKQEEVPDSFFGRKVILDVRCIDEEGRIYDIEMQASNLSGNVSIRFQFYDFRLITSQVRKGDDLKELIPVYIIAIVDQETPPHCDFIDKYKIGNNYLKPIENNLVDINYVYLKSVREKVEREGIENLTNFEILCYILAFNPDDDILKLEKDRKVVRIMLSKYEQMLANDQILTYAQQANRLEYEHKHEVREMREIGRLEGQKTMLQDILIAKYGVDASEWINKLSDEQVNLVARVFVKYDNFEDLKQMVEEN